MDVTFLNFLCKTEWHSYQNGRAALSLVGSDQDPRLSPGEPVTTASINLPDMQLDDGEIFVKSYSENEGMINALVSAGVVEATSRGFRVGSFDAQVFHCKLTPKAYVEMKESLGKGA